LAFYEYHNVRFVKCYFSKVSNRVKSIDINSAIPVPTDTAKYDVVRVGTKYGVKLSTIDSKKSINKNNRSEIESVFKVFATATDVRSKPTTSNGKNIPVVEVNINDEPTENKPTIIEIILNVLMDNIWSILNFSKQEL
jgi:hypothetical protein